MRLKFRDAPQHVGLDRQPEHRTTTALEKVADAKVEGFALTWPAQAAGHTTLKTTVHTSSAIYCTSISAKPSLWPLYFFVLLSDAFDGSH